MLNFTKPLLLAAALLLVTTPSLAQSNESFSVGNLNTPVGEPLADVFFGNEDYAYLIYPPDQCTCTDNGFTLTAVNHLLFFDGTQLPVTLVVRAQLLAAQFDAANNMWRPDDVLFISDPITLTIPDNGLYQVHVPTPDAVCVPLDDHYFLSLSYEGDALGYLPLDDEPMPGIEYINLGNGWEDLFEPEKRKSGKLIVWGDVVCSPCSVPTETSSWGAIKSLYR